ncbi:uncharacterized protein PODANS_0_1200 [Podospora anserina S mat+]|uniref:Podospora anserina S mat+ genomic DNA chromosome 2, supercontig 1 n=4 Tax=Podospora TaxID=5144 RepID=B2ABX2_PODAN|nr:uncharacterized protein PODANS_0_1200 [Podospora anserina S mat+]KAK4668381.1 hypothetical protein QC763_001200 [Podospora pseudopauciseta]KAK4678949.1 hypothetical protein QC764_001200 [Podospora pseudoanserina]VBB74997.1 Putative protein of unknown function [Podospora comata]CAP60937.1 unnamed protein product [Podospora anserina S mat+]CDP24952.1 Putative protein of unknown function [Podospora anserina S mat+]
MMHSLTSLLLSTLLVIKGSGVQAQPACTRDFLKTAADSLLAAQTAGNPALLQPLSPSAVYHENFRNASLTSGSSLTRATKIDFSRHSLDTTQCATYTEIISATGAQPYVIGVQMFFTSAQITKVDLLSTTTGDWLFNATGTLRWASRENWGTIPEADRDSREVIKAAGDAYCDIFHDKSVVVPWGRPCARLEGGAYTGNGGQNDRCDVGIPSGVQLVDRRYVIDETVGAVSIFLSFSGIPDSHEFRVEKGTLRFVHTITVMNTGSGSGKGKGKRKRLARGDA